MREKQVKKGKKKIGLIIVLVIASIIGILIVVNIVKTLTTASQGPKVETISVKTGDVKSVLDTSGTVKSLKSKTYFAPVNANIKMYVPKVGKTVKVGEQMIAFTTDTLERDNQKAELTKSVTNNGNQDILQKEAMVQAKAREAAGKANTIRSNISAYEAHIGDLQEQIAAVANEANVALENRNKRLNELKAEIAVLEVEYAKETDATKKLAILKKTEEKKAEIVAVESEAIPTPAELQAALEKANGELSQLQGQLASAEGAAEGAGESSITSAARAQMSNNSNLAELEVATVEELLHKGRAGIMADFSGVVSKSVLAEGAMATQGIEMFTIDSNEEVVVDVAVSKNDYSKIKEGQKATINMSAYEYKGTVISVSKIAELNEKGASFIHVEVKIDNPDDTIFLGVEAKVSIELGQKTNVLVLSRNGVNTGKEGQFCYVVEKGVIQRKEVVTGLSSTSQVEVLSGIEEGTKVIVDLPEGLKEGMPVSEESSTNKKAVKE